MDQLETAAEEMAQEMSKPGKFSLIERLQGRNMPKDVVDIYLDEDAAYQRAKLLEEHAAATDPDEVKRLDAELAEIDERIRSSVAHIHMQAIDSGKYDELIEQAREQFPVEYEERQSAFSLVKEKVEIPSPEREELFTQIYLAAVIKRVEMGGDVDDNIDADWVAQFTHVVPWDGLRRVTETAFKLRMTVQWMDEIQDEDFSPRP